MAPAEVAPAPAGARAPAAPAPRPLESTPPPRNALTLARLAEVFGAEAMLPPNAKVELVQEYQHAGTRYRFVAAREMGTTFKGRLIGPSGDVWSDRFDLANFPGTRRVVALALGVAEEHHGAAAEAAPPPGPAGMMGIDPESLGADARAAAVPQNLLPQAGEVWVMNVVVEEAGPDEVRYVGTDIDGRPYGAARVLKRADFEAVFTSDRGGWRLLVQVDQVQDGAVLYRQLDHARQPFGAPRKMAAAIMVANFVPEAAAY
jgi:hypothetical protein